MTKELELTLCKFQAVFQYVSLSSTVSVLLIATVQSSVTMETNACQYSSSFGDIKQSSDVPVGAPQQKLCYQTVDGSTINLDVINHQPLVCQEFIVTSPKFNCYRWMAWTVGFYALGCILQLHLQVYEY